MKKIFKIQVVIFNDEPNSFGQHHYYSDEDFPSEKEANDSLTMFAKLLKKRYDENYEYAFRNEYYFKVMEFMRLEEEKGKNEK